MTENEIAKIIIDLSYKIHVKLGPGLLESVYEEILFFELNSRGLRTERQKSLPVIWEDIKMNDGFRADLVVENKVIVELKSVDVMTPVYPKKLLTYLRVSGMRLGLLINFNTALFKDGVQRIVNNL